MSDTYARIERLADERYQATCPVCGWQSMPNLYRGPVDAARRAHGTVETCERRHGGSTR
jgi:hypothetical protein